MEDRLTRGFSAGVVGGLLMNLWAFFAGMMGFTTRRIVDWAAIMIYAHRPPFTSGELLFAFFGQLFFAGALGVVFAYLVPRVTSRHLLFRGWFFSVMTWFFIYGVTTLFKVEGTVPTPLNTAIANFIAATIYGLVLPVALQAFTAKTGVAERRMQMAPAMKPLKAEDNDDELP